ASVRIAGEQRSVATDDEGRFSLTATPGEHVVEASYISYGTQQQTVAVREGASVDVNFVLTEEAGALSEVVVVGYGTQRKVNLTGAVDQVTSEVFENRPIPNISQGLVGAVPNLNIRMLDGKPTQS